MQRRLLTVLILTVLVLAFAAVGSASAATIYVNKDAINPYPDGTSWTSAFITVQAGLNAAAAGDEVWVAKGTYIGTLMTLRNGVALYGGFAGFENSKDQRDFRANETILDGNCTIPDDGPIYMYQVVHIGNTQDPRTRIDGFTIKGGNLGIRCSNSSAVIANNVIKANIGPGSPAAGISVGLGATPTIKNNLIINNQVSGIHSTGSAPIIENNIFANNMALYGGAIACYDDFNGTQSSIVNNSMVGNGASWSGYAIYCGGTAKPVVANNIIAFNFGHARVIYSETNLDIYNNNVYGNTGNFPDYYGVTEVSGNIHEEPLFVDRTNGDYHLTANSPCIDAGDDSVVQAGWVDIDGETRLMGAHVDIGADEFTSDATPPIVSATPAGGSYNTTLQVVLEASEPASIYYTTDGTTPTASSMQYIGLPINILTSTTLKFMAKDAAGNQSSVYTEEYIIDYDAPETALALCGELGDNGWFKSDVQVCISATDTGSGIAKKEYSYDQVNWHTATSPFTVSDEGSTTIYYRAIDNAGNESATKSHEVKIDKAAPTTTVTLDGVLGNNGWYVSDVTVTLSATDTVSGVSRTEYSFDGASWILYSAPFIVSSEGTTTVYYRSIDNAGNIEGSVGNPDVPKEEPINTDPTPPPADAIIQPGPGDGGGGDWRTAPPEVVITPGPDISGPVLVEYSWDCENWFTYTAPTLVTEDGVRICYYRVTDGAGNVTIKSITIKIDKTKPITTIELGGTLGQNGWFISDVLVTLEASDAVSGVHSSEYSFDGTTWHQYAGSFAVTSEGTTAIYYRSIDVAGNIEDAKGPESVKIDKTQPTASINTPANGATYRLNQIVNASWTVADYVSGIFSTVATTPNGSPIDTASAGAKTFTVTATDYAGHQASVQTTYYVQYDYFGVLQPINHDGSSVFRQGKGRVIPVKFQLKDAGGNYISTAVARLYYAKVLNDVTGTELAANTVGQANTDNLFRYDSAGNLYIYNMDTNALSLGTWELQIVLDDGTTYKVNISIK